MLIFVIPLGIFLMTDYCCLISKHKSHVSYLLYNSNLKFIKEMLNSMTNEMHNLTKRLFVTLFKYKAYQKNSVYLCVKNTISSDDNSLKLPIRIFDPNACILLSW